MNLWPLVCAFTIAISSLPRCEASLLMVQNPGFESQSIVDGTFATTAAPTDWTVFGGINLNNRTVGVLNPNSTTLYQSGEFQGNNVGVIFLLDNVFNQSSFSGIEGGMQQTLADSLQASTRYTLSVDVGNIANDATSPHNQFAFLGFPGYRIDLLAGGNVIASDTNTLLPAEGTFETSNIVFTTGSNVIPNQLLGIRLVNLNSAVGIEVNFDNIQLDATAVPEPSTLILCTLATGIFVSRKMRSVSNRF